MDKKNVFRFLSHVALFCSVLALLASSYIVGLSYWRDPLHLFRAPKAELYPEENMRVQAAGIINSFHFDSIILGTSMLENSSSADMEKSLGRGKFVNLSLSGSNFMERSLVLRYALRKKNIKNVFYSLDNKYILCNKEYGYPPQHWTFLYDNNRLNDFKLYTSPKYFRALRSGTPVGKKGTLDRPNEWMSNSYHSCRFGGLQNWVSNLDKQGIENFLKKILPDAASRAKDGPLVQNIERNDEAANYVEEYVLSFAEKNPDVEFYLVFPPYWRYYFASMRQTDPEAFAVHQHVVRYTVERAFALGNVYVFGYEDCSFVDDIANYKDVTHYAEHINKYMTETAGKKKHLLTPDNVEAYLMRCDELARNFDIKGLNEQVKKMLAEKN